MKNLDDFKHRSVFSTDENFLNDQSLTDPETGLKTLGHSIANGAFHIVKNESQFLWNVMNYFPEKILAKFVVFGRFCYCNKGFQISMSY